MCPRILVSVRSKNQDTETKRNIPAVMGTQNPDWWTYPIPIRTEKKEIKARYAAIREKSIMRHKCNMFLKG